MIAKQLAGIAISGIAADSTRCIRSKYPRSSVGIDNVTCDVDRCVTFAHGAQLVHRHMAPHVRPNNRSSRSNNFRAAARFHYFFRRGESSNDRSFRSKTIVHATFPMRTFAKFPYYFTSSISKRRIVPPEFLKHAIPDYVLRGTDPFSLDCQVKATIVIRCECPILNQICVIYFLVLRRILVIRLCAL